ncbi:hypothetical protein HN681_01565 [archaeon]|jgi:hypothetical protein|nr:hypothetical protein [archaeon]MBT3731258.1 hypothetical protein [archaeon]MBT4669988.1 hypothetical protein [archaeon]MBT5287810.1 hypothetical protein [archaeon]MBT7053252.1 hypothetical protein [archaeon]
MFNFRKPYPDRRDPKFYDKWLHKDTTREHFSNLGKIVKEEGPFWALHYDLSATMERGYLQKGMIGVGALAGIVVTAVVGGNYLTEKLTDPNTSKFWIVGTASFLTSAFVIGSGIYSKK